MAISTPKLSLVFLLVTLATSLGVSSSTGYAVFTSVDQGRSWSKSDRGLPGTARINAFAELARVLFAGTDVGIYRSGDGGRSWRPSGPAAGRIISLAAAQQRIFAGTDSTGLLVSADSGNTWAHVRAFPARKVRCLVVDGNSLIAGTESDGVLVSTDAGATWTRLQPGLPPQAQTFAAAIVQGRLYAGLYRKGLYQWDRRGARWIKVGDVKPLALASAGGTLVAGHNPGGILSSEDLGATWTERRGDLPAKAPVWELGTDGDLLFAGAAAGIYHSFDKGRTWARSSRGLPKDSPGVAFLVTGRLIVAAVSVNR